MQTTVRTTLRIRKDLLDQFRVLALKNETSLQEVINHTLTFGLGHISDLNSHKKAMEEIDRFRKSLKGRKINIQKILEESKKDQK